MAVVFLDGAHVVDLDKISLEFISGLYPLCNVCIKASSVVKVSEGIGIDLSVLEVKEEQKLNKHKSNNEYRSLAIEYLRKGAKGDERKAKDKRVSYVRAERLFVNDTADKHHKHLRNYEEIGKTPIFSNRIRAVRYGEYVSKLEI